MFFSQVLNQVFPFKTAVGNCAETVLTCSSLQFVTRLGLMLTCCQYNLSELEHYFRYTEYFYVFERPCRSWLNYAIFILIPLINQLFDLSVSTHVYHIIVCNKKKANVLNTGAKNPETEAVHQFKTFDT